MSTMDLKQFKFGFVLDVVNRLSPVIQRVEGQIKHLNESVKNTARMREYGQNLAMIGGAMVAAGGVIGYALKGVVESAATTDEAYRHLATGLDSGAAGIRQMAEAHKFAAAASVKFNYAQTDIINNLYASKSFIGDFNAALAVTNSSLAIAKGNMGDAAQVGQSLSIFFNDFADKTKPAVAQAQHFADLIAYTSRHGAFLNVNQLTAGVSTAIGAAKAAGLGAKDLLATLQAFSAVGIQGAQAGTATEEVLAAFARGKLQSSLGVALATTKSGSLDLIGTLVNLRREVGTGAISLQQFQRASKALGIRGNQALAVDTDKLVAFRKSLDSTAINGAAMRGATIMLAAFNEKVGQLGKRWELLKETLGAQLLGPLAGVVHYLGVAVDWATRIATAHPQWVKFAVTAAAIGAGLLVVVGGAIAVAGAVMMVASFAPAVAAFAAGWALTASAVGIAVAAFGGLLAVFPALRHFVAEAFTIGANILIALAKGIWSAATYPARAMESVVSKISGFLPHSPAKEGPLRDLHRVRIVETIAQTMHPGPALAAMRRVAATVAMAAPMLLAPMMAIPAMAAMVPTPMTALPAMGAMGGRSAGVGASGISVTQHITIQGGDGETIARELRANAYELVKIIDAEMSKRGRTGF